MFWQNESSEHLAIGRDALTDMFDHGSTRVLRAGQLLANAAQPDDVLYRLRVGWAYRFHQLSDGNRPIVDVYLPGDIMCFEAALCGEPIRDVVTLTSAAVDVVTCESGLEGSPAPTKEIAFYMAWLLDRRRRRTDTLRAAIASFNARGRLASMVLDFYRRLEVRDMITNSSFNLPLTQQHIGSYLGLTVVHANRVIHCLRDEGLVNIEKHCVTLLNIKALERLAKTDNRNLTGHGRAPVSRLAAADASLNNTRYWRNDEAGQAPPC
jgi:CRP-like cAMP-binding protein